MPKVTRRSALAALAPILGAGAAAKLAGLSPPGLSVARGENGEGAERMPPMAGHAHTGFRMGGRVDHAANGFHPTAMLRDFDWGRTRKGAAGRVIREWEIEATGKEIEVAPGVKYAAWTYGGRVPGPTLRAREGELLRIRFLNATPEPHTMHFHGVHAGIQDGVPGVGAGLVAPGKSTVYEFEAKPFGLHLYHCHAPPLADHIAKGLYGAFIIDPKQGRPEADELVMVMNGFDTNFDRSNELYAANSIGFHYAQEPIEVGCNELIRVYLANLLEFDLVNSFHIHGNFFDYYPTGTSLRPAELTDTVMQCQGQRGILEMRFPTPGKHMFHAHQSEFAELGWMGFFEAGGGRRGETVPAALCKVDARGKARS